MCLRSGNLQGLPSASSRQTEKRAQHAAPLRSDLFVDEDAQQDADEGEEVHLQREPHGDREEPEINLHRRGESGMHGLRKDVLNDSRGEDRGQDFTEQPAEKAADYDAGDENPRRFTHGANLLRNLFEVKPKAYANTNNEQSGCCWPGIVPREKTCLFQGPALLQVY